MPSCAVITCRARSQESSIAQGGISFHRFPKERKARNQWIRLTGREQWVPTKTSTICSRHFNEDDFILKPSGNRFLRMGAVPCQKIVKIHSEAHFESNAVEPVNAICAAEVKIERLDKSSEENSSSDDDKPLRAGGPTTITIDPLSSKRSSSLSDKESNASTEKLSKQSKEFLRKKLEEKEESCKQHVNRIESLFKANRRLCHQNKNLRRMLMVMKKKILTLEKKNGEESDDI